MQTKVKDTILKEVLYFRNLVQSDPDNPEVHYELGVALIRSQEFKSAIEAFKRALRLDSTHARSCYNLAFCYHKIGLNDSAIIAYEDTLILNPADFQAWNNLGAILFVREDLKLAVHCYKQACEVCPGNPEAWMNLGICLFQAQNFEEALLAFKKNLELKAEDDGAWEQLGLTYYALNQLEESINAYSKALSINNDRPEIWNNLGNCYIKFQQIREAENAYRQAIELSPDKGDFWFNLGELLYHYASREEAVDCFKKVIELNPDDRDAWEYLGRSRGKTHPEEAIQCLEKVLELGKDNPEILGLLADLYQSLEIRDKEIKTRLRLARINPYEIHNNFHIAQIRLMEGKPETAYKLLMDCLTISEGEYQTWFKLSQSFQLEKKLEEEFSCLEKVIQANPEHFEAWTRLGHVALQKNMPVKAFNYFIKAGPSLTNDYCLWKLIMERLTAISEFDLARQACSQVIPLAKTTPQIWQEFFRHFQRIKQLSPTVDWLQNKLFSLDMEIETALPFGELFDQFGFSEQGCKLYEFLQKRDPENKEIINRLGLFYIHNHEYEKAIAVLKQGLELASNNYQLLNSLGEAYYCLNDWTNAEIVFNKAIRKRRDDYRVWFNLGNIESKRKDFENALKYYDVSLKIHAMDGRTWYNRGLSLMELDRQEDALVDFIKASALNRRDWQAWSALGGLYLNKQELNQARMACLRSLAINKKHKTAWNNLAVIFDKLGLSQKKEACLQQLEDMI